MYTGLNDKTGQAVQTYWAGRYNGSFQMSYTTLPYDLSKSVNTNYICDVNAAKETRDLCAQEYAKYAINRCTVYGEEWRPVWSDNPNADYQYDFSKDVLKMGEIRKKECINTNDEFDKTNNYSTDDYEKQAKDGLHIFEAPGISINTITFDYVNPATPSSNIAVNPIIPETLNPGTALPAN
jgi:hypothetical protein